MVMETIATRKNTGKSKDIISKNVPITRLPTKSKMISTIRNHKDYEKVMVRIDELIEIPDSKLTKEQAGELHKLAKMAQQYEKSIYTIKPPSTFEGILEMKMYELKLNQGAMAKKLKI